MLRNPALFLLLALFATACARQEVRPAAAPVLAAGLSQEKPDPARYDEVVVVGTNDFHGYLRTVETPMGPAKENVKIGGAEWFAGYIDILQRKYGDRLVLLDGGDLFQGTMESNLFLGKSVVDFYNLLPYRAAAVGNHEFDYGPRKKGDPDRLGAFKDRMAEAKFPFLQANIFRDGKIWKEKNLFPSVLVTAGGHKVGIIGLTTVTTPAKTLPQNVQGLDFRDLKDPTLKEARALRAQGAELVLIAAHEGGEKVGGPIYELLRALPPGTIDGVVSGHAHQEVREMVHGVPVIQSRTRGLYFGRMDFYYDKTKKRFDLGLTRIHPMRTICGTWFKNEENCDQKSARDRITAGQAESDFFPLRAPQYEGEEVKPAARVLDTLRPYFEQTDGKKKEVLGEARSDFDWYPSGENQMGFLFLEAFRDRFPEARVVYLNGGGIRRRFFKGPITYGDLFEVHPFDNFAVAVKMNGRQLKDLVRVGISGSQSTPIVLGVKVAYFDGPEVDRYKRDLDANGKKEQWETDRLLPKGGLVWEDTGQDVKDTDSFWLATSDYLLSGGDNVAHVFGSIPMKQRKYLDTTQRDVVAEYLRKNPALMLPRSDSMRIRKITP